MCGRNLYIEKPSYYETMRHALNSKFLLLGCTTVPGPHPGVLLGSGSGLIIAGSDPDPAKQPLLYRYPNKYPFMQHLWQSDRIQSRKENESEN